MTNGDEPTGGPGRNIEGEAPETEPDADTEDVTVHDDVELERTIGLVGGLAIGIGIFVILSFMMGISLWVTEPGSPSHTLAAMNIASLFGLIVVCVALILYCQA